MLDDANRRRRKLAESFQHTVRMWNVLQRQKSQHRLTIKSPRDAGYLQQRFQLAGKRQSAVVKAIIHRFLAKPIASDHQSLLVAVPDGQSKHASQMLDEVQTMLLVQVHDDFRVAVGLELMPRAKQIGSQFEVVVDFAVEDNLDAAVFVPQRLRAASNIDDAESSVAKCDAGRCVMDVTCRPEIMSVCVRASMTDTVRHPLQSVRRDRL